jgi:hypothetical protein
MGLFYDINITLVIGGVISSHFDLASNRAITIGISDSSMWGNTSSSFNRYNHLET